MFISMTHGEPVHRYIAEVGFDAAYRGDRKDYQPAYGLGRQNVVVSSTEKGFDAELKKAIKKLNGDPKHYVLYGRETVA